GNTVRVALGLLFKSAELRRREHEALVLGEGAIEHGNRTIHLATAGHLEEGVDRCARNQLRNRNERGRHVTLRVTKNGGARLDLEIGAGLRRTVLRYECD